MDRLIVRMTIETDRSVSVAMMEGRRVARTESFAEGVATAFATVTAELARNALRYAGSGSVSFTRIESGGRVGLQVQVKDRGPGIADVDSVMRDGYSSQGTLGLGLPGARRMADELVIDSEPGRGTTVTARIWK